MSDDAAAGYAGVFEGRLPFGERPALIVIDVVQAYLEPGSPLYHPAFVTALAIVAELVAAARGRDVPVAFTKVVYQRGGIDGGLFYRKVPALSVFDTGSPLGAFPSTLQPAAGDVVVTKQYASAFFGTSLASTLRARGIDTVVLAGFSTSGCVRASALDALQHGFVPFVVGDGCADRHPAPHEASLFDLQAKYAEVRSSADIIRYVERTGKTSARAD